MATRAELQVRMVVDGPSGPTVAYEDDPPLRWSPATALLNGYRARVSLTTAETTVTLPTGTARLVIDCGTATTVLLRTATGVAALALGNGPTVLSLNAVASIILLTSSGTATVDLAAA